MKLLLATDAWHPQVNGVVRTLGRVVHGLEQRGWQVEIVHPGLFRTLPCPSYPEIRLALAPGRRLAALLREVPDAIHVATEGPIGCAVRRWCTRRTRRT